MFVTALRMQVFAVFVVAALFGNDALGQDVTQLHVNRAVSPKVETMSVQVFVYLFDKEQYDRSVLPAYRTFVEKADTGPLLKLLRNAATELDSISTGEWTPPWSKSVYEEDIAILTGKEYYSSQGREPKQGDITTPEDMRILIDDQVAPELMGLFCIPRNLGFKPEQSMSSTALMTYLYSQSRWIEDYFTFAKQVSGPVPEIKLGEWSQFFSEEEVATFDRELSQMKPPTDEQALKEGFENLRTLVHTAATNPNYKLLLVIT